MVVVSDSTPLISFLKIDSLDLLEKLFGEIQIPQAVFRELTENENFSDEANRIKNCNFIKVTSVGESISVSKLMEATGLDIGESEAIVLAKKTNAASLLIDEIQGRKIAKQMNLKIAGTIGVLLLAKKKGVVSSEELVRFAQTLRDSGRFISEELFQKLLES